ncbi:MAG: zinc-binding dehydrogenase, partial [Alphaproteobacteria bacterium]
ESPTRRCRLVTRAVSKLSSDVSWGMFTNSSNSYSQLNQRLRNPHFGKLDKITPTSGFAGGFTPALAGQARRLSRRRPGIHADPLQTTANDVEAGRTKVGIGGVFSLDQIAEAHRLMESDAASGKIVATA